MVLELVIDVCKQDYSASDTAKIGCGVSLERGLCCIPSTQSRPGFSVRMCSVRPFLRAPWTARRLNQSILKKINPEYSLDRLMLKLKLWYFGHLMRRADSLEKTMMLGKIEGKRRRGKQRIRWLDGITTQRTWVWASSGRWWRTGKPIVLQFMGSQRVRHDLETEQQLQ